MTFRSFFKLVLTCLAAFWNCLLVTAVVLTWSFLMSDEQLSSVERRWLGGISFFVLFSSTLPFLGGYTSYAKRRGIAQGYNLVTFLNLFGLILVLCLPTNRERD